MTMQRTVSGGRMACALLALSVLANVGCEQEKKPETAAKAEEMDEGGNGPSTSRPESSESSKSRPEVTTPFEAPNVDLSALPELIQQDVNSALESAKRNQQDAGAVGKLGMLYYVYDSPKAAVTCFERCSRLDPENIAWFYYLGLANIRTGDSRGAIKALEKTIILNDSYVPALVSLADLLLTEDARRAAGLYQHALELDHAEVRAHFGMGRYEKKQKRNEEALEHFRKAVELVPDYADAHGAIAELLIVAGKTEEAREHTEKQVAGGEPSWIGDPLRSDMLRLKRDPTELARTAGHLADNGKIDQALAVLDEALELDPKNPMAHRNLGVIMGGQGKFEEAAKHLRLALDAQPDFPQAGIALARALVALERVDEAVEQLQVVLGNHPGHFDVRRNLMTLLLRQAKPDEAIALMRQAVEDAPDNPQIRFEYGDLLSRTGHVPEAVEQLRQVIVLSPENPRGHYLLGVLLTRHGERDEAEARFKQAIRLAPKFVNAYIGLAEMAREEKNPPAVKDYLLEGLRRVPNSPELGNAMAWHLATTRDPALRNGIDAVRYAEKACAVRGFENSPNFLDTLAAAYAEVGRFEDAVATVRRAIEAAELSAQADSLEAFRERLSLFEKGTPFHEE